MPKYKIEKGVAIPARGNDKCPLDKMQVGESFEFNRGEWSNVNSQRSYWRRNSRKNFTIRRVSDEKYRCWRTE